MSKDWFHYKNLGPVRGYQVWSHEGFLLGTAVKYEQRYELRRTYVDRGWRAVDRDGDEVGRYRTRHSAAEALRKASGLDTTQA